MPELPNDLVALKEQLIGELSLRRDIADIRDEELVESILEVVLDHFSRHGQDPEAHSVESSILKYNASKRAQNSGKELSELLEIWKTLTQEDRIRDDNLYVNIGKLLLSHAEPLIAYDVFKTAIQKLATPSLQLRQQQALALARVGATERSIEKLEQLTVEGHTDFETLSLLAGRYKELWQNSPSPEAAKECLEKSYQYYRKGYLSAEQQESIDGGYYAGINTATMALLRGEIDVAHDFAERSAKLCHAKILLDPQNYWAHATLGESELIKANLGNALNHYEKAVQVADNKFADIASTKRNALLISSCLDVDINPISKKLDMPSVAIFSGHMTDYRQGQLRFPHDAIDQVRSHLKKIIEQQNIWMAYASAACGSDLIFLGILNELGIRYRVLLPFRKQQFIRSSIEIDPNYDWKTLFDLALSNADEVHIINEYSNKGNAQHFEYTNQVMTGLAYLQARFLCSSVIPISVWDESAESVVGGTGSAVGLWRQMGWQLHNVNPTHFIDPSETTSSPNSTASPNLDPDEGDKVDIKAMLFADVVGYSKISEEEIPLFVNEFMDRIADTLNSSNASIKSGNTWGDAIYFVFDTVEEAGGIALQITEMVENTDWTKVGFRNQLRLRTGLHVGPVYKYTDPITKNVTHSGAHVNRAARIEPITPPGEVYASNAFAALAIVEKVNSFKCDYVGVTPMAKKYGNLPTYHVRRK